MTEREENTIEKRILRLLASQHHLLERNETASVTIYTGDDAARREIEVALTKHSYGDRIKTVNTFALHDVDLMKCKNPVGWSWNSVPVLISVLGD